MFINIERYINFLTKNKIGSTQFLMLYLLYRKKYDCIRQYKQAFPNEDGSMIGNLLKEDLITRGFIEKLDDKEDANSYRITDKFTHLFLQDVHEATNQFLAAYPGFIKINGVITPLTNCDRYKLALIYGERIDYSVDEHKEVIDDVIFGNQHGMIRTNVENFVRSELWLKIREVRYAKTKINEATNLENNF